MRSNLKHTLLLNEVCFKQKSILLLLFTLSCLFSWSQENKIKVFFNHKQFFEPSIGNYIEIQLSLDPKSLAYYNNNDTTLINKTTILQSFSQNNQIKAVNKTLLTTTLAPNKPVETIFYVERFALQPGTYTYELSLSDESQTKEIIDFSKSITVIDFSNQVCFSEIVPASEISYSKNDEQTIFSKYGYEIKPLEIAYYSHTVNTLPYYVELYNTDSIPEKAIYIKQTILAKTDSSVLGSYTDYYKLEKAPLLPLSKGIAIETLPKGEYILQLALIDKNGLTYAKTHYNFTRHKKPKLELSPARKDSLSQLFAKDIPSDSVYYYVASLIPIADGQEVKNIIRILKTNDTLTYRNYLQDFWFTVSPESPYQSWITYKEQVQLAEHHFGTKFQMGAETDRGRVYLQYGPPNQISDVPFSPSEYPYQIWQYDKIGRFSNRRFIFYNPSNINEAYQLLHSDMIGELQNRRWKFELNRRNTYDGDLDNPNGGGYQDHWGGNSQLYYDSY